MTTVLGTDPSDGRGTVFQNVFGIEEDSRYFSPILKNLEKVGLSLDDIYVENLCRNYFRKETSKNPIWNQVAEWWINILKQDLDKEFAKRIPVLITTQYLYPVLAHSRKPPEAQEIYRMQVKPFLQPDENRLDRVIIPFYRHRNYSLEQDEWREYRNRVMSFLRQSIDQ
jgi:hypothetical protein